MRPDEEALLRDLNSPTFRIGHRRGKWEAKGIKFPFALFFVATAPVLNGPPGFLLRSDFTGYSGCAPTSQLWHGGLDAPLQVIHRPHNQNAVMEAFKDWQYCLYHPVDRVALAAHKNWESEFPEKIWKPDKDITFLLETVHDLLHASEYIRAALPAEALNVPPSFVAATTARPS
jgi:hypothetical protein